MKSPKFSAEQIAKAAFTAYELSLAKGEPETPEPGFRTSQQWSEGWGKGRARTGELIRARIKSGQMVAKSFSILTDSGSLHETPHYKAVGK